jgi:hypothetical protein
MGAGERKRREKELDMKGRDKVSVESRGEAKSKLRAKRGQLERSNSYSSTCLAGGSVHLCERLCETEENGV